MVHDVVAQGGVFIVNHAMLHRDACLGCAWSYDDAWNEVGAMEVQTGNYAQWSALFFDSTIALWIGSSIAGCTSRRWAAPTITAPEWAEARARRRSGRQQRWCGPTRCRRRRSSTGCVMAAPRSRCAGRTIRWSSWATTGLDRSGSATRDRRADRARSARGRRQGASARAGSRRRGASAGRGRRRRLAQAVYRRGSEEREAGRAPTCSTARARWWSPATSG